MEINKQDFLKKIEREIECYHYYKADMFILSLTLMFAIFLIVLSTIPFFSENTNSNPVLSMFLMIFGLFIFVVMSKSIFVNNKMKKKYGKNPTKEMRMLIHNTCSVEDIQEYYESTSDTFKQDYLDVILEKEIAKSLGLKKDYDKAELLEKVKNIKKLEIENT